MSYKIRIRFSGLCAFVPSVVSTAGEIEAMDVLLVNSANQNAGKLLKKDFEPHTPFLKFDLGNLPGNNGNVAGTYGIWKLQPGPPENRFEDIAIRALPRDGSDAKPFTHKFKVFSSPKAALLEEPFMDNTVTAGAPRIQDYVEQVASFSWVPSIEEGLPSAGKVDPDWKNRKLAGARIRLDAGLLQTEQLGQYAGKTVLAQFLPTLSGGAGRRALTHWAVLEIQNVPDDIDLQIEGIDLISGAPGRRLTLVSKNSGDIAIEITNLCCGYQITGAGYPSVIPSADEDFELFYTLAQDFDSLQKNVVRFPIPTPVAFPVVSAQDLMAYEGGGADPVRCTLCRFSGYGS
jgi:hypothetical protein